MTCPICRKPAAPQYRPFCSRRCADVDLGRWLTGGYAIPARAADDDDDAAATPAPPARDD
jgi:endogenous inhibitor of DNA gyrase (YacG/DUF329 family)